MHRHFASPAKCSLGFESSDMPADIVNLRSIRKQRLRNQRQADAAANRLKFGQTKGEKLKVKAHAELEARRLDQAKRDVRNEHDE